MVMEVSTPEVAPSCDRNFGFWCFRYRYQCLYTGILRVVLALYFTEFPKQGHLVLTARPPFTPPYFPSLLCVKGTPSAKKAKALLKSRVKVNNKTKKFGKSELNKHKLNIDFPFSFFSPLQLGAVFQEELGNTTGCQLFWQSHSPSYWPLKLKSLRKKKEPRQASISLTPHFLLTHVSKYAHISETLSI
ncbi:hypothetical protein BB560_002102 [Smittium megazygosporum]|uniref:Uncharacterized protein n=1 Tax=Smittium megazygosporum TaxID=133381 RepID=A0A2T9ZFQ5_9FUNG|nr:hypothetical protein BB560_002102 [Smittium megazygosporum]